MHDDSLKFVSYILIVNILMIVIESEKPCWEIAIKYMYVCMYVISSGDIFCANNGISIVRS